MDVMMTDAASDDTTNTSDTGDTGDTGDASEPQRTPTSVERGHSARKARAGASDGTKPLIREYFYSRPTNRVDPAHPGTRGGKAQHRAPVAPGERLVDIPVNVPRWLRTWVEERADAEGVSLTAWVRRLLIVAYEGWRDEQLNKPLPTGDADVTIPPPAHNMYQGPVTKD